MGQEKSLPRIIWLLWYQGMLNAPYVVKHCIDSWARENPDWQVVVLDNSNIGDYISVDSQLEKYAGLPLTKQSNLVRLILLSEHGGIWADATTYCTRPLDDWIYEYMDSDFFAFYKPGPDRLLSTWFLACTKGCAIIPKWRHMYISFFSSNSFIIEGKLQKILIKAMSRLFGKSSRTTRFWFSPLTTKILRVYPYFIFHYMFERLLAANPECKDIWSRIKKISADGPHMLQSVGLLSTLSDDIKEEIDEKRIPIYKLTWKYDVTNYSPRSVLHYLLEGKNQV